MPCDIVLSRETLNISDVIHDVARVKDVGQSKVIRMVTGPYSHAMLYFKQSIIHAEKPGVYAKNPQRVSVAAKDDLLVLRHPELTQLQQQGIEQYCRLRVGSLYDAKAAFMVPIKKRIDHADDARQFCSRLVAKAYESVGIKLVKIPIIVRRLNSLSQKISLSLVMKQGWLMKMISKSLHRVILV